MRSQLNHLPHLVQQTQASRARRTSRDRLRVAYAIQNVGGIDFSADVGDTVPVKQTLLGLRQAGHEVDCFHLRGQTVLVYEDISALDRVRLAELGPTGSAGFKLIESSVRRIQRELRLPYFAFFDLYRFYEACMRSLPGYDLCHEHNGLFCAGAALACRRLGLPYVLTFSSDPLFERALGGRPLHGLHAWVAKFEAQFTYRLASRIICVSSAARQHLSETWNVEPDKITVMPNGVDTELFRPECDPRRTRAKWDLADHPVVCFVGGFQAWHGLDRLIEAFARVLVEMPDVRLLLVGDGRARPIVDQAIATCGVEHAVQVTGLQPQDRVPEMLAAADVAVLPYPALPRELWFSPLKLYEYMAAGKAIVASRSGQIAEVIRHGENGWLVEPGDIDELAAVILKLLRSPDERARLGHEARRDAVTRYSWDQYIERLEQIYRDVLENHPTVV